MKTYGDDHGHPGCHGCQICFGNDPHMQIAMEATKEPDEPATIDSALPHIELKPGAKFADAVKELRKRGFKVSLPVPPPKRGCGGETHSETVARRKRERRARRKNRR